MEFPMRVLVVVKVLLTFSVMMSAGWAQKAVPASGKSVYIHCESLLDGKSDTPWTGTSLRGTTARRSAAQLA